MTDLKPCPFCGGEAKYYHLRPSYAPTSFTTMNVECSKCHSTSGTVTDEVESKAIERVTDAWNTRAENTCYDQNARTLSNVFFCSECGFNDLDVVCEVVNYCPSCGAKVMNNVH